MADESPARIARREPGYGTRGPAQAFDSGHRRAGNQRKIFAAADRHMQWEITIGTKRIHGHLANRFVVGRMVPVDDGHEQLATHIARAGAVALLSRRQTAWLTALGKERRLASRGYPVLRLEERLEFIALVHSGAITLDCPNGIDLVVHRPYPVRNDVQLRIALRHMDPIALTCKQIDRRRTVEHEIVGVKRVFEITRVLVKREDQLKRIALCA